MIGVYLLYKNNVVVYVGQSQNIKQRICQHGKWFDRYEVIECSVDELNSLETRMIKEYSPEHNKIINANRNNHSKNYGKKPIFNVKSLKKGQKIRFPKDKEQYIYQYLNNFNRSAEKEGKPNRYTRWEDLEGTLYIRRII